MTTAERREKIEWLLENYFSIPKITSTYLAYVIISLFQPPTDPQMLTCPFCKQEDFDKEGLEGHLFRYCEEVRFPHGNLKDMMREQSVEQGERRKGERRISKEAVSLTTDYKVREQDRRQPSSRKDSGK